MKKTFAIFIIIIITALIIGCGEKIKPGESKVQRPQVSGVSIEEVRSSETVVFYETSGTLRSRNTAIISAKIMGEVTGIKVKPGDAVKKGDILLTISAPDVTARAEAAKEAFKEAQRGADIAGENKGLMEKTFERYKKLYEEKALTGQEFDEVKAKKEVAVLEYERARKVLDRAEAGLQEADAFKGYAVVRSPLNGIVGEKSIDIGNMALPGAPLVLIEEPVYRVEAAVDEKLLSSIHPGTQILVSIDPVTMNTTGRVAEIVRQIDPLTRTFTVKIDLNETSRYLRGGIYAKVKIPIDKKRGLFIPRDALITRGDLSGVYAVNEDGIVTLRFVKTGKISEGKIEVLSGLSEGEKIIVKGIEKAVDGGKVEG
jgi:RND family efflux transporter MFP subunit